MVVLCIVLAMSGCATSPADPGPSTSMAAPTGRAQSPLAQDGFAGLRLDRDVADVSLSDLEAWFRSEDTFSLRGRTGTCGTASSPDMGLVAVTDADLAVHAFIVRGAGFATPEGISVGSSLGDVRGAYGSRVLDESDDVVVIDDLLRPGEEIGPRSLLFVFDIDADSEVVTLRAGRYPWLMGCDGPGS